MPVEMLFLLRELLRAALTEEMLAAASSLSVSLPAGRAHRRASADARLSCPSAQAAGARPERRRPARSAAAAALRASTNTGKPRSRMYRRTNPIPKKLIYPIKINSV